MKNWSVDLKQLKKHPKAYSKWRLEQLINFGLDGEKLNPELLKKHWKDLKIDRYKRKFLSLILPKLNNVQADSK